MIVAIPNDNELASEIGKKGSQNGITFYNRKSDTMNIVVLTPTDVNTKFYALAETISIADIVLISTRLMNSLLGESIIAASLLNKNIIFTNENDISVIMKNAGPATYELVDRKGALGKLNDFKRNAASEEELRIDIDKSFPVKGVGTVLLGLVRRGKVKVHDALQSSSGKEVSIRSIQVHDDDFQEGNVGDRVGLAVKGVDDKDIEKGDILAKKIVPYIKSFNAELKKSPLAGELSLEGMNCTLVSSFSVVNCKISKKDNTFSIELEKQAALSKGDNFLLLRDKQPRVFAAGQMV